MNSLLDKELSDEPAVAVYLDTEANQDDLTIDTSTNWDTVKSVIREVLEQSS